MAAAPPAAPTKRRTALTSSRSAPLPSRARAATKDTVADLTEGVHDLSLKKVSTARPAPASGRSASSLPAAGARKAIASSSAAGARAGKASTTCSASSSTSRPAASAAPSTSASTSKSNPLERARESLASFNAALSILATASQAAFKASAVAAGKEKERDTVLRAAREGGSALHAVREAVRRGEVRKSVWEVEKTAGGFVRHLVTMELYAAALLELNLMRSSLLSLYTPGSLPPYPSPSTPRPPTLSYLPNFFIPTPPPDFFDSSPPSETLADALGEEKSPPPPAAELVPLVLGVQQFVLGCLFRLALSEEDKVRRCEQLAEGLSAGGDPLAWRGLLPAAEDASWSGTEDPVRTRVDQTMSSLFGTLSTAFEKKDGVLPCAPLLKMRTQALLYVSSTRAIAGKVAGVYDRARSAISLYGSHAEAGKVPTGAMYERVREAFDAVLEALEGTDPAARQSGQFRRLAEGVQLLAKRAEDLAMVSRISSLLGEQGEEGREDPAQRAGEVCAKLTETLALFERWVKSGGDGDDSALVEALAKASNLVPFLASLRTSTKLAETPSAQIDRILARLRGPIVAHLRPGPSLALITEQGKSKPRPTAVQSALFKLLEALVAHTEVIFKSGQDVARKSVLAGGSVEALLVLAYSALIIDSPSTPPISLAFLERCIPLLAHGEGLISDTHVPSSDFRQSSYSLSALVRAYATLGGSLLNAKKHAAAVPFLRRAAQITRSVVGPCPAQEEVEDQLEKLSLAEVAEEDDKTRSAREGVRADFVASLQKRWQHLALAHHALGNTREAHAAYADALVACTSAQLEALEEAAKSVPISTLAASDQFAGVVNLIKRATLLSAFTLRLTGHEVSLARALREAGWGAAQVGAVLEVQVHLLEGSAESADAIRVLPSLLEDALLSYDPKIFPLRRARVMVRRMQAQCTPALAAQDLSAAASAAEIEALCSGSPGEDVQLRGSVSQLLAFSHLWLGFHAQMTRVGAESVALEARNGLQTLERALEGSIPASPGAAQLAARARATSIRKDTPPQAAKKKVAVAPPTATRTRAPRAAATKASTATKAAFKTPQPSRTLARRPPLVELKTPPSAVLLKSSPLNGNARRRSGSISTPRKAELKPVTLDDPERAYNALDAMATLLGLLGYNLLRIRFLRFIRRLAVKSAEAGSNFVLASAALAGEYLLLGKTARAGSVLADAEARILEVGRGEESVGDHAKIVCGLRYAEYLAAIGNSSRAAKAYGDALALAEGLEEEEGSIASAAQATARVLSLQRVALAANTASAILQRRGDLTRAIAPAQQSAALHARALSLICAYSAKDLTPTNTGEGEVFKRAPPPRKQTRYAASASRPSAALCWSVASSLCTAYLRSSSLYAQRGTYKESDFWACQALVLAREISSSRLIARVLNARAALRIRAGRWEEAVEDLNEAGEKLGPRGSSPEAVECHKLRAELSMRQSAVREASAWFVEAQRALDGFVLAAQEGETPYSTGKSATPLKGSVAYSNGSPAGQVLAKLLTPGQLSSPAPGSAAPGERVLPSVQAYLLRMRIGMLQMQKKRGEDEALLLRLLAKLAAGEDDRADEYALLAAVQLSELMARLSTDPVLGLLPDSVLSLPAVNVSLAKAAPRLSAGGVLSTVSVGQSLREVDALLLNAIALSGSRAESNKLRQLTLESAMVRHLAGTVGSAKPSSGKTAQAVASTLDLGLAVTLRREMLEAIEGKLAPRGVMPNELGWPVLERPVEAEKEKEDEMAAYWRSLRDRYRSESAEPVLTDPALSTLLPAHWTTVSLHLNPREDTLLLVRHRRGEDPLLFQLPIDRLAAREDDNESFSYAMAREELDDIVAQNNASASSAKDLKDSDRVLDKREWWELRAGLDKSLEELCLRIEGAWLGAFKAVFNDSRSFAREELAKFKSGLEKILKRSVARAPAPSSASKASRGAEPVLVPKIKLDESVVNTFAALDPFPKGSTKRTEGDEEDDELLRDLEDLWHYLRESSQIAGVQIDADEADDDQIVCDIRTALEDLHRSRGEGVEQGEGEHIFLLLDKTLQGFPWESLPCLRGRSVSRLPALSFLRDRLDLGALRNGGERTHEITVDAGRTSYVLNAGGDLHSTQDRFAPWLEGMKVSHGWRDLTSRVQADHALSSDPQNRAKGVRIDSSMRSALTESDLFLYFGHGGAEQFIQAKTLRHLPHCATSLLWGCSSGYLKPQGEFDPTGTPYLYLMAGAPSMVGNLWDVTDGDIDKFALGVFEEVGMSGGNGGGKTLGEAVAGQRDKCRMKWLNGAAVVVYGVPVRFKL